MGEKGTSLNFKTKVDIAESKARLEELKKLIKDVGGISMPKTAPVDNQGITAAKIAQEGLRKTILEGQAAVQKLRLDNLELEKSYKAGKISAQEMAAAEKQARNERRQLAEATKAARQAQQTANGSYDEANNKLKALGRSIKSAEGGFNSTNPAIKAQITEYNKLNTALKDFDAEMGNHQRKVADYPTGLNGVIGSLKQLALAYVSVQGAMQAGSFVFNTALQQDASRTSLEYTLGSAGAANDKLKELAQTADRLGLNFNSLTDSYASFAGAAKASNFPLSETNKIFNSIAGAGARFHLSSDQISGSLLAIQQMISKGTVQSEELRGQLGERLPGAFAIAARAMGVTEKELGKLLQNGDVLAADLLPKLSAELDKTFSLDKTTKMESLTAASANFTNVWAEAVSNNNNVNGFFINILRGLTSISREITELVNSRSWGDFFSRLTDFTGQATRDIKTSYTVKDEYTSSVNQKNTALGKLPNGFASANKAQLKGLVEDYQKALATAAKAYVKYEEGVQSGRLKDDGSLQDYKSNYLELHDLFRQVQLAYKNASPEIKKTTKELTDAQLSSIKDIRKRIAELSALPGSAIDGSLVDNRIDALKARLKGPIKSINDATLSEQIRLQKSIDDLVKKGTDKQLSADDQEIESVKKKYEDKLAEAVDYNKKQAKLDEENRKKGLPVKNLRVNSRGILEAQTKKVAFIEDKQAAEKLKVTLDVQKRLFDDFENYKAQVGEKKAKERFENELGYYESYIKALEAKRDGLLNIDQKSKGGNETNTAVVKQQIKLVEDEIAAEEVLRKKNDDKKFADAYQAALTHSQKLQIIDEEYNRRRAALGKNATQEQIDNLNRERDYKIRSENAQNAYEKGGFEDLMLHFDEMTRGSIIKRLTAIKEGYAEQYKQGKITADELAKLNAPIDEQFDKLNGSNVFNRIISSVKEYRKQVGLTGKDSEGAKEKLALVFSSVEEGAAGASEAISIVANSLQQLGIGGDGLQEAFKNIQGVIGGAGTILKGLKPGGNPVDIITGSIGLLSSAISLFDRKDKNLQKKIDGYKKELDLLGKSYAQLDRMVNNSVGESIYTDQAAQIENLRKQQAKLTQMRDAEIDKKKTDEAKVTEFQNQIDAIPGMIDDINKAISQNLIQTTFKDLSNSLADAFTEAFAAGEDAAGRFDDVFEKVIANAIKNSLKLKILDPIVKKFTDDLTAYALANNNSVIGFDFDNYKDQLKKAGELFQAGLKGSEEFFKDNGATSGSASAVNNNIKSITSDQANAFEGITRGTYDLTKQLVVQGRERNMIMINTNTAFANLHSVALDSLRYHEQTAVNTFNTVEELKKNNKYLADIVTNTKGTSLRGGGLGI
jgi:tape measure domain-containing protein